MLFANRTKATVDEIPSKIKEGELKRKEGLIFKDFEQRYCVLDSHSFYVFKNRISKSATKVFDITHNTVIEDNDSKESHTFKLMNQFFQAPDAVEHTSWLECLQQVRDARTPSATTPLEQMASPEEVHTAEEPKDIGEAASDASSSMVATGSALTHGSVGVAALLEQPMATEPFLTPREPIVDQQPQTQPQQSSECYRALQEEHQASYNVAEHLQSVSVFSPSIGSDTLAPAPTNEPLTQQMQPETLQAATHHLINMSGDIIEHPTTSEGKAAHVPPMLETGIPTTISEPELEYKSSTATTPYPVAQKLIEQQVSDMEYEGGGSQLHSEPQD